LNRNRSGVSIHSSGIRNPSPDLDRIGDVLDRAAGEALVGLLIAFR
jgi:hypothetical protein